MGKYFDLGFRMQRFVQRHFRRRSPILPFLLCCLSLSIPLLTAQVSVSTPVPQVQISSGASAKGLYQSGRFAEAEVLWQRDVDRYGANGDRLNQSMALSNLSLTQQQLGKWDAAKAAIAQSLSLLNAQSPNADQQRVLAATLDIQGELQQSTGQPEEALKTWKTSADLYLKGGNGNGAIASQINQAQALQDLGLYPKACKTVLNALSLAHKGCEISESSLKALQASTLQASTLSPPSLMLGLRSLGNIFRVIGQPEQSQIVLKQAWQLAQYLGDTPNLSALSLSAGNTARALGNKALASGIKPTLTLPKNFAVASSPEACFTGGKKDVAGFYGQAITCYRSAEASPIVGVQAQLNLLNLLMETRQWSLIPDLLSRLQSRLAQLPSSHGAVSAQLKLAQNLMCLQAGLDPQTSKQASPLFQPCLFANSTLVSTTDSALQPTQIPSWLDIKTLTTTAYHQAQSLGDQVAAANALGYVAAVMQQTGTLAESQQLTEQALQQLSVFNHPELVYPWQWQLGRLYQRQGNPKAAIAAYTLAYETLQSLRRELVATDPDIQFTFRDRVEPVYRELVDLLLQPESIQEKASGQASGQEHLKQARDVIESLQLAELNNFFREACIEARVQPIDRLDPKAAVVYGIVLPERLAVILSLPGKPLRYYATPLTSDAQGYGEVDRTVDDLYATLHPFILSPNPLQPKQKLYDWLLRPAAEELKNSGIETLVFVLDGVLRGVPVAALHDGHHYLAQDYGLALTPGLQLLSSRPRSTEKQRTLIGGLAESRPGFVALPGVEQEVKEISDAVSSQVLLNGQFTRDRLQAAIAANQFSGIHLATHAQFSSKAENTFLLTYNERVNVKNLDQLLRESDRPRGNPIELLILSACQTAAGDKRATLGLAGLAVRSGARSTLATLWSVQDQSTAELMTHFYKALQPGVSKAQALRQAQLKLLNSPRYQNPYFWAPFVLVGNWL
jgi:CHAT domain-containing protein